jgi:hypothetical protein
MASHDIDDKSIDMNALCIAFGICIHMICMEIYDLWD